MYTRITSYCKLIDGKYTYLTGTVNRILVVLKATAVNSDSSRECRLLQLTGYITTSFFPGSSGSYDCQLRQLAESDSLTVLQQL